MNELIHVSATTLELQETVVLLSEKLAQPFYSDERKLGISQYLGYLFFELSERKREIAEFEEARGYLVE